MRNYRKTMIVLALFCITGLANGQANSNSHAAKQQKVKDLSPEQRAQRETQKMSEKLTLNDEQKQRWLDASRERHTANAPLKQKMDGSTTPEERAALRKEMRSNQEVFNKKVLAFLNDEQKKKLSEHRKKRHDEKMQHRKGHPGAHKH